MIRQLTPVAGLSVVLLAMGGPTCRLTAVVSGRIWGAVLAAGMFLGLVPTLRAVPAAGRSTVASSETSKRKTKNRSELFVRGLVYRDGKLSGMWIVKLDPYTGRWKKFVDDGNNTISLRVSPDGQTMAYHHRNELWTADTDTAGSPGKVGGADGIPCWSPDGKWIVAATSKKIEGKKYARTYETWKFSIDGSHKVPLALPKRFYPEDYSSDGKWLVQGGRAGLLLISPDGKRSKRLAKARGFSPRFSPDGRKIAFHDGWENTVYVTDVEGKTVRAFPQTDNSVHPMTPVWSPDGTSVATLLQYMQTNERGKKTIDSNPKVSDPRIEIIDLKTGKRRVLTLPVVKGVTFYPAEVEDWR